MKANATESAGAIVLAMFGVPTRACAVARQLPVTANAGSTVLA